jgi:hypothetical protein
MRSLWVRYTYEEWTSEKEQAEAANSDWLAGGLLDGYSRIAPFDERYEQEASRKLVFSELYEASKQTANPHFS